MTIGLLKEPEGENRVALLPESVKTLIQLHVKIIVESRAGERAYASDKDYEDIGASIHSRGGVLQADLILGIQPPTEEEQHSLKDGQVLVCLFQPLSNKELVERFLDKKNHQLLHGQCSSYDQSSGDGCPIFYGHGSRLQGSTDGS